MLESGEISSQEEYAAMSMGPAAAAAPSASSSVGVVDGHQDENQDGKREGHRLRAPSDAVTSKAWQLATLLVPILLTTWLTFWVSQKQDNIEEDINKQSQLFSQQLQLSEELYKRRFDAYDKLYAQLVQLNGRLQTQAGEERGSWNKTNADQVTQFSEALNLSKLHMSKKVEDLAVGAWMAGSYQNAPLLSQSIQDLETAMKKELDEWMLGKGAPAAESKASKPKKSTPKTGSSQ
jgi:hypothetical protein